MATQERCPSCRQVVKASDFICSSCELILHPALTPNEPARDVSVVRRMLEAPRPDVTSRNPALPRPPPATAPPAKSQGPTKVLVLPPDIGSIPRVVVGLSMQALNLTEFEAWLVSLIDGRSPMKALCARTHMKEYELRVMLQTLQERGLVAFAPPPPKGASKRSIAAHQPIASAPRPPKGASQRNVAALQRPEPAQSSPRRNVPTVLDRPSAPVVPPPPPPETPPQPSPRGDPGAGVHPAAKPKGASRRNLPALQRSAQPAPPPPPADARIQNPLGNRNVLEALKSVKRAEPVAAPLGDDAPSSQAMADHELQLALRLEQTGKFDEAIAFLEKAISIRPDAGPLYNRLALVLLRERADFMQAERLLKHALKLEPHNEVYSSNLKQVLAQKATRRR